MLRSKKMELEKQLLEAERERRDLELLRQSAENRIEEVNMTIDGIARKIEPDDRDHFDSQLPVLPEFFEDFITKDKHFNGNLSPRLRKIIVETGAAARLNSQLHLHQRRSTRKSLNETGFVEGLVLFALYHNKDVCAYTEDQVIRKLIEDAD